MLSLNTLGSPMLLRGIPSPSDRLIGADAGTAELRAWGAEDRLFGAA